MSVWCTIQELFKRLVPYQCLGSMWSRRNKRSREVATVIATVDFFNAVSYRVIATILKQPELAAKERARLIEKWIEVAHELRILKNFSSLKAVLSGLTYQAIHRLKQVWKEVDEYVSAAISHIDCTVLINSMVSFEESMQRILCCFCAAGLCRCSRKCWKFFPTITTSRWLVSC